MAFAASNNASSSMADINVTPLVDVMLVLLIIFMITAPMLDNRQLLTLPGEAREQPKPTEPLRLRVEAGDVYWLEGIAVTPAQLDARLREWRAQNPDGVLKVDIDPEADYQTAARAMAAADRAGIDNIGLNGI